MKYFTNTNSDINFCLTKEFTLSSHLIILFVIDINFIYVNYNFFSNEKMRKMKNIKEY